MLFSSPVITVYFTFLAAVLGLCFGSFCNAWAWRIAHRESIAKGRSHCAVCSHPLGAKDLVPLFSYLFLRGKCRYCGEKISPRYPLTEAVSCLLFVSILLRYDLSLDALRYLFLGSLLLTLSLVDLDTMEIPDGLLLAGAVAFLLRLATKKSEGLKDAVIGIVAVVLPILLLVFIMEKIKKRPVMGGGDIKLFAVLALHFDAGRMVFLLIFACIFGLLFAAVGKKKGGEEFPFGPSISLAAWVTMVVGDLVLNWYIHTFF